MDKAAATENLDKFVGQMMALLQDAKTFAEREIPIFMKEILTYGMYKNVFMAFVLAVISGICLKVMWSSIKKLKDTGDDVHFALSMLTGIILVLSILIFVFRVDDILQIYFAPRLYLIEFMKGLVSRC